MKKNYTIIANWKMNLSFSEEINFAKKYKSQLIDILKQTQNSIIICPSYLSLDKFSNFFSKTKIGIGAQDCSKFETGSHTGQISASSLKQVGCKYCIIGHSETRKENKVKNKDVALKFSHLIKNKISPIICIGEKLSEYKSEKTISIIQKSLDPIFDLTILTELNISNVPIFIAYEPIWAIGTGAIPPIQHLNKVFLWLSQFLKKYSKKLNCKLIYGGSVNTKSINFIKKTTYLDGFLVGGTSLNFQEFAKIVKL